MNIQTTQSIDRAQPQLLRDNIGPTCFRFLQILIARSRAAGHLAQFVCKSPGDRGRYDPPGFGSHVVTGHDGRQHTIVGVSHDVIYFNGEQRDAIVSGNFELDPIFKDGQLLRASPGWGDPVPHHEWRASNVPLPLALERLLPPIGELPDLPPPPPPTIRIPSYGELGDAPLFNEVSALLEQDMRQAGEKCDVCGRALNAGSGDWIARTVHSLMVAFIKHGDHREKEAVKRKHRNEWRAVLHLPPV